MTEEEKPLVLIVDDNAENVRLLGMVIKDEGYLVGIARDGAQALEMIVQHRPDLVLLDVMMPGIDGFAVCRRLKESAETRDTPVILLTARAESEDIVQGFEAGAVDYVTKPFNTAELLARVRTQLDLQQTRRKLARAYDDLKALQQKLLEAERIKTLTEAAGGAAHEINQPLQVIVGYLNLLEIQLAGKGDEASEFVAEALRETESITQILKNMQAIKRYEALPYPGGTKIVDYAAAARGNEEEKDHD